MNPFAWIALGSVLGSPPEFPPLTPAEEARRDALTRYGLGIHAAQNEKPTTAVKQLAEAAQRDPKAAAPHRELARVYAELGRDASAIREARATVAIDSNDSATALLLAKLLKEGHNPAEAVKAFQLAIESPDLQSQPAKLFTTLVDLGRTATAAGDPATAEAAYLRALGVATKQRTDLFKLGTFEPKDLDRQRIELYERLGEAQVARKKFDSAAAAFETARDLAKQQGNAAATARLHSNLSKVHAEKGDTAAAIAELEKYLAFLPASVLPYERYADLLRNTVRGKDILPILRQFADRNPKNTGLPWLIAAEQIRAGANVLRGISTFDSGDAECFRILVKALVERQNYSILLGYADDLAKAARGRSEEGTTSPGKTANVAAVEQVRLLHAAIKATTGHTASLVRQLEVDFTGGTIRSAETLELVNYLAFRDGKQAELSAALQAAARVNGASVEVYQTLFKVLRQRRQWRTLVEVANAAKNSPAFMGKISTHYFLAEAHAELGQEPQCLKEIDYVISNVVADGRLDALLQKARLLNLLGKPRESLKVAGDVRKEYPASTAQQEAMVIEADAYHRLKENLKAEGILRELLAENPDDILVLNNLGYQLADQSRKLPEAETMIRRAIELDRDDRLRVYGTAEADRGTYLDSLGWVLFRRGELEQACDILTKATQLPDSAQDAVVWDHLGDVQYRLNRKAEAKKSWAKAVELYKDSHTGRESGRMEEARRKQDLP